MKRLCVFFIIGIVTLEVSAQRSFSDDKSEFFSQALTRLRGMNTEAANKVAFDYNNAWTGNFTADQQDLIHKIALRMDRKGYQFEPYFWHYFSYLAYTVSQAHLNSDQVSEILKINDQVVGTMSKAEYGDFLLGLNIFMARRYLSRTKNLSLTTDNGSFRFELLDEFIETEEEPEEEVIIEESIPEPIIEESVATQTDSWDSGDDWSDDDWSDDDWSDDSGDDYSDNWVDNNDTWGYDVAGEVIKQQDNEKRQFVSVVSQDHVANAQARYVHPVLSGPAIQLENNSMLMVTPYDSFQIKETDGTYLLKNRVYAGEHAIINWPADSKAVQGAVVNLKRFFILADHYRFWTPNATLTFPKLFEGALEGTFEFKSQRRPAGKLSYYPIFTSNYSNTDIIMNNDRVRYRGGIQIRGHVFSGLSVSNKQGRLTLLDGKGNKAVLRAIRFDFHEDSTIYTAQAALSILHGSDSVFHPSVEVYINTKENKMVAIRTKKYNVTPFKSTYFKVNINAETVSWDLETDSIEFSILNGKDLVPVTIESNEYFNKIRFSRLGIGFNFHPISMSVFYANKYGIREFADQELADHYQVPVKQVKGAMRVLEQYGFAEYNQETGLVRLNNKAFMYYNASGLRVDYDNIMLPSLSPGKPNAIWRLDSGDMIVNGVGRYYYTSDYEVYAEPDSGQVKLLKNRNIRMNGMVNAGEFQYRGKNFEFDYEGFLVHLNEVDSIRIQIQVPDSLKASGGPERSALSNHLNETSGTLYLDNPNNRSGKDDNPHFPDFASESDAVVYFDGPEVLNGSYDKSVKFIIPPFDTDSLDSESAVSFDGTFNSGGIFPTFQETLRLQADNSLGFTHQIPPNGYHLYGTEAKTYEKIHLSNRGIRGGGKIDFITATIYSEDFVYFPDSVAAYGRGGVIKPGEVNGASYPEAVLVPYRMHWEPRIDSMNLRNLRQPFKFYNATATLDGAVNITSKGVYGIGTMLSRGSRAISHDLTFKEFSYSARHAEFEVLTDNPEKPAMAGDDIKLNFDLQKNIAVIEPEKRGVAAISFPYAQMKTSITRAVWDLEDSVVTMTKPREVPIENSYFYTTRKELDSLAFNAEQATYDLNTKELNITGIPYIIVADAKIIPEGNQTTILENSELQAFNHAEVIIDTLNEYHYLYNGEIRILSRNQFIGTAMYQLVIEEDTFAIKFDRFVLEDVFVESKPMKMTVSGGEVLQKDNVVIAPGFYYKGDVKMYANKKALELDGSVKLDLQDPAYDAWVLYERKDNDTQVHIDFDKAVFTDESQAIAGLHYDLRGSLYGTFVEHRKNESDEDFFMAKGVLEYDTGLLNYRIEKPAKTLGESYEGSTLIYNDSTKNIIFEGPVTFFSPYTSEVTVTASVLGSGNIASSEYAIDALLGVDFKNSESYMKLMAADLTDIIERLGPPLANDISLQLLYKLANITSDKLSRGYETASLKDYKPLLSVAEVLQKSLLISGVKMKWSQAHKSWFNTTKLAISNIGEVDVNAKLDGFIEIKKDNSNNDVLNLFITPAPGTWYFISYANNNLMMYSSNSAFNDEVGAQSNYGKARPDEMVLVLGDETETLTFINNFRETYFGIKEKYNLISPDDISLEDEEFNTIEEDKDDGFGF